MIFFTQPSHDHLSGCGILRIGFCSSRVMNRPLAVPNIHLLGICYGNIFVIGHIPRTTPKKLSEKAILCCVMQHSDFTVASPMVFMRRVQRRRYQRGEGGRERAEKPLIKRRGRRQNLPGDHFVQYLQACELCKDIYE